MKTLVSLLFISCIANILVAQEYYQVTVEILNVRDTAYRNGTIVGKVYKGDSIYVVNYSPNWSNVKLKNGTTGYVVSKYISTNFQQYSQKTNPQENPQGKNKETDKGTSWVTIVIWIVIILVSVLFGGKPSKEHICDYCGRRKYEKTKPIKGSGCSGNKGGRHLWRGV